MKPLVVEARFAAPKDRVFDVFSDLRNAADRIEAITQLEVLTDGPVGVGTVFRETRKMMGKEATEEMTITEFVPGASYTTTATSCGCLYTSTFTFDEDGDGTRVTMTFHSEPQSLGAKVMSCLFFFMRGFLRKCLEADFADLRKHLEGPAPATT
jgi:hypothetical protein